MVEKEVSSLVVGDYGVDDMDSVKDLELVRMRPMLYLRDLEIPGQIHVAFEIIDNVIDEIIAASGGSHIPMTILLCKDVKRGTYQFVVRDRARGIPIGINAKGMNVFLRATTVLNTSAKFGKNSAYVASGGLNGVGMKLGGGLSTVARAISHRPEQSASILIRNGVHPAEDTRVQGAFRGGQTGVTFAYETDPSRFAEVAEFAEYGYLEIIERLKKYVFFNRYDITFYLSDEPLPTEYWEAPIARAEDILDEVIAKSTCVWTAAGYNPSEWIRQYWKVSRPFNWQHEFTYSNRESRLMDLVVRIYHTKFEKTGAYLSLVNNIPVSDPTSYQYTLFNDFIVKQLSKYISDKKIQEFCVKSYKPPLYLAIDIKFARAKFVGNNKDTFRDLEFRAPYKAVLEEYFATDEGLRVITTLFSLLEDDIKQRYAESLKMITNKKPIGRLFENLKNPEKFYDCSDRHANVELFVVEGESAGGCENYDKSYQAMYLMTGKPVNILKRFGPGAQRIAMVRELLTHPVFADLFTIINYDLYHPDMSTLAFRKVFIFADADKIQLAA